MKTALHAQSAKPLFVQVSVRIPEPLRRQAKILAARLNITLSQMLVQGLHTILEQLDTNPVLATALSSLKVDDPLEMEPELDLSSDE